jgi:hypothetical protein
MYEVFRRWIVWISTENAARAAPQRRRGYGSPREFARFVNEALADAGDSDGSMLDASRALRVSIAASDAPVESSGTSMATHRSFVLSRVDRGERLELGTVLSRGAVVAMEEFAHDVTPILDGQLRFSLERRPTYLMWQRAGAGVRVLTVTPFVFHSLRILTKGPVSAGALIMSAMKAPLSERPIDAHEALGALALAASEGILHVGGAE